MIAYLKTWLGWSGGCLLLALAFAALTLYVWFHGEEAFADDAPPQTEVVICEGGLPDECGGDRQATILDRPTFLRYSPSTVAHVRWHSGDDACLWTASGTDPHRDAGGARDCGSEHRRCGFYSYAYTVWGVSGSRCNAVSPHVSPCAGGLCY